MRLLSQALEFRTLKSCDGLSSSSISYFEFKPFIQFVKCFFKKEYDYAVEDCFIMHAYGEEGKDFLK